MNPNCNLLQLVSRFNMPSQSTSTILFDDCPTMSSGRGLMSIPTELRLDIFERLLRFDCPLRRIKLIEELDGTLDDDLRQHVRGGPADISIIFACRTTYREALPILYKQSTTSLCHDDVCLLSRELGFTRCKPELLTNIVIVDWLECGPWTTCKACSKDVRAFLGGFDRDLFPRLKTMTLDLECFKGGYAALGEQLPKQGVDAAFDFTAPGCLRLRSAGPGPSIDFRFTTIASVWAYYSVVPTEPPGDPPSLRGHATIPRY
ncbi:hypothetical protein LTR53_012694 [Teratosphaeriaceae sp. CCFEE 6253]|nr:hypothetical protein LTR53_012694 [Teratosphaeriaceae sp. CCFEE 6253]